MDELSLNELLKLKTEHENKLKEINQKLKDEGREYLKRWITDCFDDDFFMDWALENLDPLDLSMIKGWYLDNHSTYYTSYHIRYLDHVYLELDCGTRSFWITDSNGDITLDRSFDLDQLNVLSLDELKKLMPSPELKGELTKYLIVNNFSRIFEYDNEPYVYYDYKIHFLR